MSAMRLLWGSRRYQRQACGLVGCVLVGCLLAGCQRVPHQTDLLERGAAKPALSSHQLRVLVNEYVVHSGHRIELRADEILGESQDTVIRKHALLWKINGISASFRAAARNDPLGAFLDLWILNRQMIQLADSAAGHELFGPWQVNVVEELAAFDDRLKTIHHSVGGDVAVGQDMVGEAFVAKFAADFPLTSLYFDREPMASRYIDEVSEPSRELMQVVANLDENVDELKKLSLLYAEHLPKQARWQAELLLLDVAKLAVVQQPLQDFSQVTEAVSVMAGTVQALPELVVGERLAIEALVSAERQATLLELENMRAETLVQLEDERAIVLSAIGRERAEIFDALRGERLAATNDLRVELSQALVATDAITERRTREFLAETPALIDHAFRRTWQLCGGLSLALLVLVIGVLRFKAKTRAAPAPNHAPSSVVRQAATGPTLYPRSGERKKAA